MEMQYFYFTGAIEMSYIQGGYPGGCTSLWQYNAMRAAGCINMSEYNAMRAAGCLNMAQYNAMRAAGCLNMAQYNGMRSAGYSNMAQYGSTLGMTSRSPWAESNSYFQSGGPCPNCGKYH